MTVPTSDPAMAGDASGMCVANLDIGLRLLEANDEFIDNLGPSLTDAYGHPFSTVVHSSVEPVIQRHLGLLTDGRRRAVNTRFVGPDGARRRLSGGLTGLAVRGDDGAVTTIVVLVRPDDSPDPARLPARRRKPLSELDAVVLEGVAAGSSTVQMARTLFMSRQGIDYHVAAMLRRFQCSNRSALVAKAYAQGVLAQGMWPPKVTAEFVR